MRILHLLDRSAGWPHQVTVAQLLDKLDGNRFTQQVATIDRDVRWDASHDAHKPDVIARRFGLAALAAPALRRYCRKHHIQLVHAWGPQALTAARSALLDDGFFAVTVFDPALDSRGIGMLRTCCDVSRMGVISTAQRVQQRLVEQGVPIDRCVVIRPGVDFARITAATLAAARDQLGLTGENFVVLAPECDRDTYGHLSVAWSVLMRWYLDEGVRIIVPGTGPSQRRVRRLIEASECPQVGVFTEDRYALPDLLAAANVLVSAGTGDVDTTGITWSMASSVPVIAPATYAVAEMLSNDLNALLFKADPVWTRRAVQICAMYDRIAGCTRLTEVARGQAYEVFGLARMIRQHVQFYENLHQQRSPADGIVDPAMAAS